MTTLWLGILNVGGRQWPWAAPDLKGRGCLGLWVGAKTLGFPELSGDPSLSRPWPPGPCEHFCVSTPCRFSTKSWLSQVCHVCQKSMMFGVKCKHCR